MRSVSFLGILMITLVLGGSLGGCSTAPKGADRADFLNRASTSRAWFERGVPGLREQIDQSAGYVVFPDVAQWGILIGGGTFGRGAVCRPDGSQIGWAAINTGSIGLQAGVQGFRMLMVIEDQATLSKFMANQLSGSATGVAVAGEAGASGKAPFSNGLAVYQGANQGLMAGVNVGLDIIRYRPLGYEG